MKKLVLILSIFTILMGCEKGEEMSLNKEDEKLNENYVTLIIEDVCLYRDVTNKLLDTLKKYQVKAEMFAIANKTQYYPEIIKRICDEQTLGNHGYSGNYYSLHGMKTPEEIEKIDVIPAKAIIDSINRVNNKYVNNYYLHNALPIDRNDKSYFGPKYDLVDPVVLINPLLEPHLEYTVLNPGKENPIICLQAIKDSPKVLSEIIQILKREEISIIPLSERNGLDIL